MPTGGYYSKPTKQSPQSRAGLQKLPWAFPREAALAAPLTLSSCRAQCPPSASGNPYQLSILFHCLIREKAQSLAYLPGTSLQALTSFRNNCVPFGESGWIPEAQSKLNRDQVERSDQTLPAGAPPSGSWSPAAHKPPPPQMAAITPVQRRHSPRLNTFSAWTAKPFQLPERSVMDKAACMWYGVQGWFDETSRRREIGTGKGSKDKREMRSIQKK